MTEDNVMEFCQWLISEKGIEAGNLSDYINNNEEEVLKLAQEFKNPKFKVGGKINIAAEKFQGGGKTSRADYKEQKTSRRDLRNNVKENYGFNNDQFTLSYLNLKNQFRNNGLDRRTAKLAAQRAMYTKDTPSVEIPQMEMSVYSYQPTAKSYSYTDFEDLTDFEPMDIKGMGYDSMSFSDAFAAARRAGGNTGNNTFVWRGNTYGTKYKNEVNPVKSTNDDHIYNGGVIEDVIVTAPDVIDGGLIGEVVVTAPGESSRQPKFRTKTMPGRFGLAHYQDGGRVYKALRIPEEHLELIIDKGDSIVMRTPNPANGSYTYIKRKGEQDWSGNRQNSMGDFEEFKKEQANAEARRIIDILKKPAKFDDGGEIDGYKITGNETSSIESFVRDNGDSVFLTRRLSTFPGYNGADSIIRIKPVSGNEIIMHNMPYDGTREWKGFDLSNMKEINPMKLKTEALNDLFKEKLNFKKNHK